MSPEPRKDGQSGSSVADELKLQAWLARAELRNPSVHKDVSALAQMRDELRVKLALGKMEAREEWGEIEERWRRVKAKAENTADDAQQEVRSLLDDIRAAYKRMTS